MHLISSSLNVFYLTGFGNPDDHERAGYVLQTKDNHIHLITSSLYTRQAEEVARGRSDISVHIMTAQKSLSAYITDIMQIAGEHELFCESKDLSIWEHEMFQKKLPHITLTPADTPCVQVRMIKSYKEQELLRTAGHITANIWKTLETKLQVNMTERDILHILQGLILDAGCTPAFPPIVAVDKNSSEPHYDTAKYGNQTVRDGSVVLVDFGVRYRGYCSDTTRTVQIGTQTPEFVRAYTAVRASYDAGLDALMRRVAYRDIDVLCKQVLTQQGFESYPHSTGHGLGLAVHEAPSISALAGDMTPQEGHVITLEPALYLPQWGVRYEDTILITSVECEILTEKK